MIGDAFVFDGVAHPFNFTAKNAYGTPGQMFANHLYAFHATLTPDGADRSCRPEEFLKEWTPADIRQMVYDESDTDMLVAMPLPLTDLFRDGLSPWETCAELASARPRPHDLLGLGQPAGGPQGARPDGAPGRRVRRQGVQVLQRALRLRLAVPVADGRPPGRLPDLREGPGAGRQPDRRAQGRAAGPAADRATQTWDMDGAAANFPDINFVIFHVGLPFIDETCWQLIRYPNLYASLAATINFLVRAPRMFAEILGKLLFWCGEDKIVYGSEAPIFHPQWALQAFKDFSIPQDLCDGYGYPQLTDVGQAQDPRREPAAAARHGRRGDEGAPGPPAVALNGRSAPTSGPAGSGRRGMRQSRSHLPARRSTCGWVRNRHRLRSAPRTSAARRSAPSRSAVPRSTPRRSAPIR